MATIITLYKKCKITRDRNARVDELANYLSSFSADDKKVFSDCQYQQIELNKILKLELDQAEVGKSVYNYLDIYQDAKHFYYFINKAVWKSTKTVEFELTMDTVNTFADDFTFNKKTHITRQHKDRITPVHYIDENISAYVKHDAPESTARNKCLIIGPWENEVSDYGRVDFYEVDGDTVNYTSVIGYVCEGLNKERIDIAPVPGSPLLAPALVTRVEFNGDDQGYAFRIYGVPVPHLGDSIDLDAEQVLVSKTNDEIIADQANGIYYCIEISDDGDYIIPDNSETWYEWTALFSAVYELKYRRIIDEKSEGIEPPQFKVNEYSIPDSNTVTNWNLLWRTNPHGDNTQAVDTYLIPDDAIDIKVKSKGTITASDLVEGRYYYIMAYNQWVLTSPQHGTRIFEQGNSTNIYLYDQDGKQVGKAINHVVEVETENQEVIVTGSNPFWTRLNKNGNNIDVVVYQPWDDIWAWLETKKVSSATVSSLRYVSENTGSSYTVKYYQSATEYSSTNDLYKVKDQLTSGQWSTSSSTPYTLTSIDNFDRTDTKNIKLISIPYSFFKINPGDVLEDSNWVYDTTLHVLRYEANNRQRFETTIECGFNPMDKCFVDYVAPTLSNPRIPALESKLYNSEFYIPKFVYDNFNYQFQLENMDVDDLIKVEPINIGYKVTNTINSRFMFAFNQKLKRSTSDYDNVCLVNRNNELTLYNNDYLNYIKSGYNYDKKNKDAQLVKGVTGVVAGGIGGAVATGLAVSKIGAAAGTAAGPVGTAIGAGIGAVVGVATSLISLGISQSQADRQIQQKLDEKARQATAVAGSDDIDLLTSYTGGNKAKFVEYKCSDRVANTLNDLFYYCGYSDDIQEVPDLTTRKYFNFIQCEPVFNEEADTPYKEYLEDIKARYAEGVTVYHRTLSGSGIVRPTYDWNQEKENWEMSLL